MGCAPLRGEWRAVQGRQACQGQGHIESHPPPPDPIKKKRKLYENIATLYEIIAKLYIRLTYFGYLLIDY